MADRCGICRGSKFIDAIDSNGHPYRGCARCSVAPTTKPRRWRKVGPHEYTLRMGPVRVEVERWGPITDSPAEWRDAWGYVAKLGHVEVAHGHDRKKGSPLAQCQADAIAAVERWRDGIR